MSKIEHLHTLIKSLSKTEKRYFRWGNPWKPGDKIYGDLYDLIEKDGDSVQDTKDKLRIAYPDAVLEPAYKHLYKMLMRSLRNYEADKSVENKLINLIGNVKILFNKGIFELCFSEIEKGKKLAIGYEKFDYYILFARLELQYLSVLEFPNIDEPALIQKQNKLMEILNQETFLFRHASLYEILTLRHHKQGIVRSEIERTQLNDLLLKEYQVTSTRKYPSFDSDKLHLHFQSTFFLMTGSPNQSLKIFKELNLLFQERKNLWADSPVSYIYLLHGILTDLYLTEKYEDMGYYLQELKSVNPNSDSLNTLQQKLIFLHQLGMYIGHSNHLEAQAITTAYENGLFSDKGNVHSNTSAIIHFRMIELNFILTDYSKSLQLVNIIVNSKGPFLSSQLYALGRLLHMLIHLELKNEDYLYYEVKSVERKLKSGKKLFTLEKITIQFLKKWVNGKDLDTALKTYEKQLEELEKNKYENHLLRQFPFRKWVVSRISKKPMKNMLGHGLIPEGISGN